MGASLVGAGSTIVYGTQNRVLRRAPRNSWRLPIRYGSPFAVSGQMPFNSSFNPPLSCLVRASAEPKRDVVSVPRRLASIVAGGAEHNPAPPVKQSGISQSISIRELKHIRWRERCIEYKSINIHQRTKTGENGYKKRLQYKSINIHQRTKTGGYVRSGEDRISQSISIRELKRARTTYINTNRISQSISIRELKLSMTEQTWTSCISQSISIRELKPSSPVCYISECISQSISIRELKPFHQRKQRTPV